MTMAMVNEWLKAAEIPTHILACIHGGIHLPIKFVTHDLHPTSAYTDFPHFMENEHALEIKAALGLYDRH
jgi:hypothetical protein